MIIKPLKPTLELLQTEALNRRLLQNHRQKEIVSRKARNLRAGYNGEKALQYPLSFLPPKDFLIFHGLRLPDTQGHFQMDILLLSQQFILILEVKNIRDHMIFDEMGQAYRIEEDESEQGFANPVDQVRLQHLRLLRWLRKFELPAIPIEKLVVYSNPSTIIKNLTNNGELSKMVIHKERLLEKIDTFSNQHSRSRLTDDQLTELSFQLLTAHTEAKPNVLKKYDIKEAELIKGVICPECSVAPMQRKGGKWRCTHCEYNSKTAHQAALKDYALLINEYVNNREAREFLKLNSSYITKELLQKEKGEQFGVSSGRKYKIKTDNLM